MRSEEKVDFMTYMRLPSRIILLLRELISPTIVKQNIQFKESILSSKKLSDISKDF